MNILLVYAHPEPTSLNGHLKEFARHVLESQGQKNLPFPGRFILFTYDTFFSVLDNCNFLLYTIVNKMVTKKTNKFTYYKEYECFIRYFL